MLNPNFCPRDRSHWRDWLEVHHADETEVWLVLYKKSTGKQCTSYREALEEALCFGWIDGLKKGIDDERYAFRFTPRKRKSKWSELNLRLAKELRAGGLMAEAGLAAYQRRKAYAEAFLKAKAAQRASGMEPGIEPRPELGPELEQALRAQPAAWANFEALAPGYRQQYIAWLTNAKRPETRAKRLLEAICLLNENKKLGMK